MTGSFCIEIAETGQSGSLDVRGQSLYGKAGTTYTCICMPHHRTRSPTYRGNRQLGKAAPSLDISRFLLLSHCARTNELTQSLLTEILPRERIWSHFLCVFGACVRVREKNEVTLVARTYAKCNAANSCNYDAKLMQCLSNPSVNKILTCKCNRRAPA